MEPSCRLRLQNETSMMAYGHRKGVCFGVFLKVLFGLSSATTLAYGLSPILSFPSRTVRAPVYAPNIFLPTTLSSWSRPSPSFLSPSSLFEKRGEFSDNTMETSPVSVDRRTAVVKAVTTASAASALAPWMAKATTPTASNKDARWNLWTSLPVFPYGGLRRTLRREVVPGQVWTFDQVLGIYYVQVPIRMTVVTCGKDGLLAFAPVPPTPECLRLVRELVEETGRSLKYVVLPSVAVEHKVAAGPFARAFPDARLYVVDKQYSFPLNLPNRFLGLPSWTEILPRSSRGGGDEIWGGPDSGIEHEVLTVKPGIGSMYQDVALFHRPSGTLLVCDAVFAAGGDPPPILTEVPEYRRALLWHARDDRFSVSDGSDDNSSVIDSSFPLPADTEANRRRGWRRIVLLFCFFFPGSARGDLGLGPLGEALQTPGYPGGWGGWKPFAWKTPPSRNEAVTFARNFGDDGNRPTVLPIIQIILDRDPAEVRRWLDVVTSWDFRRVVPAHLDAPLPMGPAGLRSALAFADTAKEVRGNRIRACDEDVRFLRAAEEGPLNFSVYRTDRGALRGDATCALDE